MSLLDAAGIVTGDIWCSGAFMYDSPLKDLLDTGNYTLEQLLQEDELLQELRGVHPQLIEFFSSVESVTGLVRYVTQPPPPKSTSTPDEAPQAPDTPTDQAETTTDEPEPAVPLISATKEETKYVRYTYMSCEVICSEIDGVIDMLVDGFVPDDETKEGEEPQPSAEGTEESSSKPKRRILDLLFDMLFNGEPGSIDDYRAGYFDKILSVLFRKRPEALGQYINTGGERGTEALMNALFQHLYAHSIMQIVQRLLLPQPPLPFRPDDEDNEGGGEMITDPMDGMDIDGFGSFRCNWSESPTALNLLLKCLIEPSPHAQVESDEERRLSLYQNASEVLITIIQNSPLTAPILCTLTTDPVLLKLITAATTVPEGETFSPHDSRLTCSMNVLESLILQLGGYGSVGIMMEDEDEEGVVQEQQGEGTEPSGEPKPSQQQQEIATSETLIVHLPQMMSNLLGLLKYEGAEAWETPMQFSLHTPQKMLGSSRLRIVRLLESLVLLGDPNVDTKLCESECLQCCLDLFWKFQWCSMLHQSVANLLVHVFEGANARAELQSYFLVRCNLLGRVMGSFVEFADVFPSKEGETVDSPSTKETEAKESEASTDAKEKLPKEDADGLPLGEGEYASSTRQSVRCGYMGHVIIICQALVHACSNDGVEPSLGGTTSDLNGEGEEYAPPPPSENPTEGGSGLQDFVDREAMAGSVVTDDVVPLILAQLVEDHPLFPQWEEFVQSTLASETAIQSTPLGGFPMAQGMDPLQLPRPGLSEDGDYNDDDGAEQPLPPRGLLVGGDVIDMDDNDLDIAASMMAGLGMGRGDGAVTPGQDLLAGIPQQSGDGPKAGYMFDDPLGDGKFKQFEEEDDDDDSSDEESEISGKSGDSGGAVVEGVLNTGEQPGDAPVMDLFAGNFDPFSGKGGPDQAAQQNAGWSDFANFDNAFEPSADQSAPADNADPFAPDKTNGNIEDVFGDSKDHSVLLEEIVDPANGTTEPEE
eukprot:Nitzschia sp. Nitz4//scaffold3_size479765//165626//168586//NITZ4_000068-RA/size479765-processed-gene-0.74-mRNA-1//1//CDS//3329550662//1368//frame0